MKDFRRVLVRSSTQHTGVPTILTMEAIAKYDFKATADDELSFKRGETLKVSSPLLHYLQS